MESNFKEFLLEVVPKIQELGTQVGKYYWRVTTTGSKEAEEKFSEAKEKLLKLLSNKEYFARLKEFRNSGQIDNALLSRQLTILYNQFVTNQLKEEDIKKIVGLETEIESIFTNFRAEYQGKKISDNEINKILTEEQDSFKRQEVWEASKQVGEQVSAVILEAVKHRNKTARELGYSDYFSMCLESQELNEQELFKTLDKLKALTDGPFKERKGKLDEALAKRFGIGTDEIMPWHYSDRFFQEVPNTGEMDQDKLYQGKDIAAIASNYFSSIGLDVSDILKKSDLYEREGKNQHAYCIHIDKKGDVRILCNITENEKWMSTTLHELGHGVYDKYLDISLPYLLREPAHMFTTEAIAMLFGRLTQSPEWLVEAAGISPQEAKALDTSLREYLTLQMLVFIRWSLVMVYFERALYKNTDCDLNTLWWDKVEEIQLVRRPAGRNAADWASKIHFGIAPVYYHNYILGELTASQIQSAIKKHIKSESMVNNEKIGRFLIENIFKPANRFTWNEMLVLATGEPLNPEHFVKQFVK